MVANVISAVFEPGTDEARPLGGPSHLEWSCSVCFAHFDGPREFRRHQRESNHWHCADCNTILSSRAALLDHCKAACCSPYVCNVCAGHFGTLTLLATHAKTSHGGRRSLMKSEQLAESVLLSTEVTEDSTSARVDWADEEAPHELGDKTRRLQSIRLRPRREDHAADSSGGRPISREDDESKSASSSQPLTLNEDFRALLAISGMRLRSEAAVGGGQEAWHQLQDLESEESSCLPTVRTGDAWRYVPLHEYEDEGLDSGLDEEDELVKSDATDGTGNRTPSLSRSILDVPSSRTSSDSLFDLSLSRSEIPEEQSSNLCDGASEDQEIDAQTLSLLAQGDSNCSESLKMSFASELAEMLLRIHVMIFCALRAYAQRFIKHVLSVLNEEPPHRLSARNEPCVTQVDIS